MKLNIFLQNLLFFSLLILSCKNNNERKNNNDSSTSEKQVIKEENKEKFGSKTEERNAQFVSDAISDSYHEIRLADVALNKSMNSEIKKIAQHLKDDHNGVINDFKKIADTKVISVPTGPDKDAENDATTFSNKKMSDFDMDWLEKVKDMHEKAIKKFEEANKDLTDSDIKALASSSLSKLREHLNMVMQLQNKMKR